MNKYLWNFHKILLSALHLIFIEINTINDKKINLMKCIVKSKFGRELFYLSM